MTSAGAGLLFSIVFRAARAEVLELRHAKPLASIPHGFLDDVMEDYNCWDGDLAEVVIHANYSLDQTSNDIVVATCRAACLSNVGCQAWSLNQHSHGAQGNGHCWLKHSCENGDADPLSVSGLVDHKNLMRRVQAPNKVDATDLVGVMHNTNCWGRDLAKVAISSTSETTLDELIFACRNACVADQICAAWTLNRGLTGMQGQGHCWLKTSCAGRKYDAHAVAGIVIPNPSNMDSHETDANDVDGDLDAKAGTGVAGGSSVKMGAGSGASRGASSNTQAGPGRIASSTVSVADSSREADSSTTTSTGSDAATNAKSSDSDKTRNKLAELRFLQHGGLAASSPQLHPLRPRDGNLTNLSKTDKGIIGSVVGASTGALAVGLLAGLLHPTPPQPTRGLVQPSPILPTVAITGAGAKSHAPRAVNSKTNIVIEATVVTGVANGTKHKELEREGEEEEEESPVKQWWGWVFLIPFSLLVVCCFAVLMFKAIAAGTCSKHRRSRWYSLVGYSRVGSETSVDEGMTSSDSLSP